MPSSPAWNSLAKLSQLSGSLPSGHIIPFRTSLPIWTMSGMTPASRNARIV